MSTYLRNVISGSQTQGQKSLTRTDEVKNSDGAYVFQTSDLEQVRRFLILGSEGGSYYATEQKLTQDNAEAVLRALKADGIAVVNEIVAISDAGRAPKNDPALFALALAASFGNDETRKAAFAALPKVARIGTHLFHFADFVAGGSSPMRGWGKGLRNGISNWYTEKSPKDLAYQVAKYGQRDGWSHKDLLILAHPKTENTSTNEIFKYIINGWENVGVEPHSNPELNVLWAAERLKQNISEKEVVALIEQYNLPMECVPTDKRSKAVYESVLLHGAGLTWIIRNLGNLSKQELLLPGKYNESLKTVLEKLSSVEQIKRARVHPLQMLIAYNTYKQGHGDKGSSTWTVQQDIVDALNGGFYMAFDAIEPANKRFVLGLDVSGSMGSGAIAGLPGITPAVGTAVMSMVTKRTEKYCAIMGFADQFRDLGIGRTDTLESARKKTVEWNFGRTDCSLPVQWALDNKIDVDCFVIYTDNETNSFSRPKPYQLLDTYRQKTGIAARMVNVCMVPNGCTINDPTDKLSLNIVGFDTTAPAVISDFAAGKL